jgi:phage shock protein A
VLSADAHPRGPLVVSTADSWPAALLAGLERSYREKREQLTAVRQGESEGADLARGITARAMDLESAQPGLRDQHRRLLDAGRAQEAGQAADALAAAQQEAAQLRKLLPKVIEKRDRLSLQNDRLQTSVAAGRGRIELFKSYFISADASRLLESMTDPEPTADDAERQHEDPDRAAGAVEARVPAEVIAQMERELGQQAWPPGLMELRPADSAIRILFSIEPPGAVLLIAILDGPEAVRDQYLEALVLSADALGQMRAGQAPEVVEHVYDGRRRFLEKFFPGQPAAE